jgi:hypothetical protein
MVEAGVFFNLVNSLQRFDSPLVRESHFQVIAAMIESGAPAHFANEILFIIY